MDYSATVAKETDTYYLYDIELSTDAGQQVADIRDGEVQGQQITLPVQLDSGGTIDTEEVTIRPDETVLATNAYSAQSDGKIRLFVWKAGDSRTGRQNGTVYSVPNEYVYDERTQLDPYSEYKAYAEPENVFETIRAKIGKTVAPIVDNMKQGLISNDWVQVLRDEDVVEVDVTIDASAVQLAVVHVAVEIRVYLIVEEEVDGAQREVVKQFNYAPPFPVTAAGARIENGEDGFSVIAPRCTLDELTTAPFYVLGS